MSFFEKLFIRKSKSHNLNHRKEETFPDTEEEDLDEEEDSEAKEQEILSSEKPELEEVYLVVEREVLPAKIICPDCGGITLEGLEFCDKCGGEL